MKSMIFHLLAAFMLLFAGLAVKADNPAPNRMLVVNELGQFIPFNLNHVGEVRFVNVANPAKCDVSVADLTHNHVKVTTSMTDEATQYMLKLVPDSVGNTLNSELDIIAFLQRSGAEVKSEDLEEFNISEGMELDVCGTYQILSAAADRYGAWDRASRTSVTIPYPQVVGNPQVAVNYARVNSGEIDVAMIPNEDVSSYYMLFGYEDRYTTHYETWKDELGFLSFEDMVMRLGTRISGSYYQTWRQLNDKKVYEVIVLPLDIYETPGECLIYKIPAMVSED